MNKRGKLVRDKIPSIIGTSKFRVLAKKEFQSELAKKLVEEAKEFQCAPSIEELADVMEVVRALLAARKWTHSLLEQTRRKKAKERGSFKKRIFLKARY